MPPLRLVVPALVCSMVACTAKAPANTDTTAANAPSTPAAAAKPDTAHPATGAMATTGDPDHDFLRMTSDHHKGLIAMAHETIQSTKAIGVKALAKRLDAEQDKDMDQISTMLDSVYKDPHTPTIMPEHQAMLDALESKTGAAYDQQFLENVVKHHQQGVRMIDDYLAKAKSPAVKGMAEAMKATQEREIKEFQTKVASKKD